MRVKIRMAFSIPKAVKKLEFEFWILELNVRLASSQFNSLELGDCATSCVPYPTVHALGRKPRAAVSVIQA